MCGQRKSLREKCADVAHVCARVLRDCIVFSPAIAIHMKKPSCCSNSGSNEVAAAVDPALALAEARQRQRQYADWKWYACISGLLCAHESCATRACALALRRMSGAPLPVSDSDQPPPRARIAHRARGAAACRGRRARHAVAPGAGRPRVPREANRPGEVAGWLRNRLASSRHRGVRHPAGTKQAPSRHQAGIKQASTTSCGLEVLYV